MACCQEYQTECLKVVNIGYLKSFISDFVQNSTNGSVIHITRTDDTYCPTYSELTGGTIIQTWIQGATPRSDRDGIVVSSRCTGTNANYASNQLVNQKDLSLKYTRFNTLSISRTDSGDISECGGSAELSYTYNYTRSTKSMNNSCSVSTSSENINGSCDELTYHATYGSVSECIDYSIGKNGTVSSSTRTDSVYASTTFRGSTKNSASISIRQKALTGSYSTFVSHVEVTTAVTATKTSSTSFGCDGGLYSADGTRYYNSTDTYSWDDSCGVNYPSVTSAKTSSNLSSSLGSKSGVFSSWDCCEGAHSDSATLTFTYDGKSGSASFSQSCEDCSSTTACTQPSCCEIKSSVPLLVCSGTVTFSSDTCGTPGEDLPWAPDPTAPTDPNKRIYPPYVAVPTDNFGQTANYTKDRPTGATAPYAPPVDPAYPGKGWWSGPFDGDWSCCKGTDNGIDAKPHPEGHPESGYETYTFNGITYYQYTQDICIYEYTSAITASEAASWNDKITYDVTLTTTVGGKTHWIRYEVPTQFRNWIALRPHYSPTTYGDLNATMTMRYTFAENTAPNLRVGYVIITTSNDDGREVSSVDAGHGNKNKPYTKEGKAYIYQVGTNDMCGCQNKYPGETKGYCDYFPGYCNPC